MPSSPHLAAIWAEVDFIKDVLYTKCFTYPGIVSNDGSRVFLSAAFKGVNRCGVCIVHSQRGKNSALEGNNKWHCWRTWSFLLITVLEIEILVKQDLTTFTETQVNVFIGVSSRLVLVRRWQQTPKISLLPSRHKYVQNFQMENWLTRDLVVRKQNFSHETHIIYASQKTSSLYHWLIKGHCSHGRAKEPTCVLYKTRGVCVHIQGFRPLERSAWHGKGKMGGHH